MRRTPRALHFIGTSGALPVARRGAGRTIAGRAAQRNGNALFGAARSKELEPGNIGRAGARFNAT
eukprot:11218790-Lingulodinium_polyedra.AAC.1